MFTGLDAKKVLDDLAVSLEQKVGTELTEEDRQRIIELAAKAGLFVSTMKIALTLVTDVLDSTLAKTMEDYNKLIVDDLASFYNLIPASKVQEIYETQGSDEVIKVIELSLDRLMQKNEKLLEWIQQNK